ncbi:MAG: glycosyltransferase family 4 protein [bacterium]
MRILMVTPYLPYPPASGGQIRSLNLLKYLSSNNEIYLVSLYKNHDEKKYIKFLTKYCKEIHLCKRPKKPWQLKNILKSVFTSKPFLIVRNYSPEALVTIKNLLKRVKFDVIHSETFYVMPHIPKTKIPILLVEQTIEYKVYKHFIDGISVILRPFLYIDVLKLRYWERYYWNQATLVATVSQLDKKIIRQEVPDVNIAVIPNGAGDEMFEPTIKSRGTINPILLFLGNFFWLQNIEAAQFTIKKILPQLESKVQNFKIVIAGQQAKTIKTASNKIKIIEIEENDSGKVKELYQSATLFIAPIFGPGGTRLKILAAMAAGLPVISTSVGIEGLNAKDNQHVLVANSKDEFVIKILKALSDKKLYKTLQENSYQLAKNKYNWKSISKKLEKVYKNITK